MIFCTVGTQLPYNRLLKLCDESASIMPDYNFFMQIGESDYIPKNSAWVRNINEIDYHDKLKKTQLIIGHAGMGTILSALDYNIPIILVPRKHALNEHRNDHQLATAHKFRHYSSIFVYDESSDFTELIFKALSFVGEYEVDKKSKEFSQKLVLIVNELLGN